MDAYTSFARVYDTLNRFHVVYVECADSVTAFISHFKHFFRIDKWHNCPPKIYSRILYTFFLFTANILSRIVDFFIALSDLEFLL